MCQACKARIKSALRSWLNIRGHFFSLSPSPCSSAPAHTSITRTIADLRSPNRRNIPTIARERAKELRRSVEAINYIEQKLKTQQGPRIRMQRYAGLQAAEDWTVARLTEAHKMEVWSMNHEWESFTTTCHIFSHWLERYDLDNYVKI